MDDEMWGRDDREMEREKIKPDWHVDVIQSSLASRRLGDEATVAFIIPTEEVEAAAPSCR
jgi:hypothetical protein